jgi:hypothetical protein
MVYLILSLGKEAKRLKPTDCPPSSTASTRRKPKHRTSRNHQLYSTSIRDGVVPHLRYTHDRKRTSSLPFLARQRFTASRLASTRSRRGEKGHSNTTHPGTKEGPHTAVTHAHWIRTQLSKHTIPYELHIDYPPPASYAYTVLSSEVEELHGGRPRMVPG